MLVDLRFPSTGFPLRVPLSFHFFAISDVFSYNANHMEISNVRVQAV
jgi:hypothetical protein